MTTKNRITAPALRDTTGEVWSLPDTWSHSALQEALWERGWRPSEEDELGFLDSHGKFLKRYEALTVARLAGQTNSLGPGLYSYDLWDDDGTALWGAA